MNYVVIYDKILANRKSGVIMPETIRFETESDAKNWITAMRMVDHDKTFTNFRIKKVA